MKTLSWPCRLGLLLAAALSAAAAVPAEAADHTNLERGLPVRVEDAYPVAYRAFELQGIARYEKLDDERDDRLTLEPVLEWGFAPNWQMELSAPFFLGEADDKGSGDLGLELLHNFNTESLTLPAFALSLAAVLPTGEESQGVETTLEFIATKTIGDEHLDRLHLNLAWSHKFNRDDDERKDRYEVVIGYSRRLGPDTVFLADFVREQELEEGREANIFEVGLRRQLDPLTVFSVGVGAGVGDDSPDVIVTLGLQRSC